MSGDSDKLSVAKPKRQLYGAAAMGAGPGRPKGSVNRATSDVRAMVAAFASNKAAEFERWIELTADGDPERGIKPQPDRAATLYLQAIEYHIPKLARTEVTGPNGGALQIQAIERKIVKPDN
jgi:hypothetical protein